MNEKSQQKCIQVQKETQQQQKWYSNKAMQTNARCSKQASNETREKNREKKKKIGARSVAIYVYKSEYNV